MDMFDRRINPFKSGCQGCNSAINNDESFSEKIIRMVEGVMPEIILAVSVAQNWAKAVGLGMPLTIKPQNPGAAPSVAAKDRLQCFPLPCRMP